MTVLFLLKKICFLFITFMSRVRHMKVNHHEVKLIRKKKETSIQIHHSHFNWQQHLNEYFLFTYNHPTWQVWIPSKVMVTPILKSPWRHLKHSGLCYPIVSRCIPATSKHERWTRRCKSRNATLQDKLDVCWISVPKGYLSPIWKQIYKTNNRQAPAAETRDQRDERGRDGFSKTGRDWSLHSKRKEKRTSTSKGSAGEPEVNRLVCRSHMPCVIAFKNVPHINHTS